MIVAPRRAGGAQLGSVAAPRPAWGMTALKSLRGGVWQGFGPLWQGGSSAPPQNAAYTLLHRLEIGPGKGTGNKRERAPQGKSKGLVVLKSSC